MNLFLDTKNNNIIDSEYFIKALNPFIKDGDFLYVEIDLMSFGKIYDVRINRKNFLDEFYKIFRSLIGSSGNIAFPSFSYSWGDDNVDKVFNISHTKGKVGLFPEYLRKEKEISRNSSSS